MARLFGRRARVTVGSVRVDSEGQDGLRVAFTIAKTLGTEPNSCEVTIANLNEDTRGKLDSMQELSTEIESKGLPIDVEAGYQDTLGAVWIGRVRSIESERTPTGWLTRVRARDGIGAGKAPISKTLKPGADLNDAIGELVASIRAKTGLAIEQVTKAVKERRFTGPDGALAVFTRGITLDGSAMRRLEQLADDNDLDVVITDEEILLLRKSQTTATEAVVLGPDTGLVGSPVRVRDEKRPGVLIVKVKALLQPLFHPGGGIRLSSETLSGDFRISKLQHQGDTHGAAWHTDLEAVKL
jgi:hypothetical protein